MYTPRLNRSHHLETPTMKFLFGSLLVALCFWSCPVSGTVVLDWAMVGDSGNAGDVQPQGTFGAVDYAYSIAKHEVTNDQYAEFLNAVAGVDTHGLYNPSMGTSARGGIVQACPTTCSYSVKHSMGSKPVVFVSFWDAARFTNWLHNGQPTGAQNNSTTEDGAYTLAGVTNPDNSSVTRNVGTVLHSDRKRMVQGSLSQERWSNGQLLGLSHVNRCDASFSPAAWRLQKRGESF